MSQTIRELHEKRMKMWDASIISHMKYIDENTGQFRTEYTNMRNCPVCNSTNEIEIFYKEGGRYVKCQDCTMVYLNPVFKDSALQDFYETNHSLQSEIVETDVDEFYIGIYRQGIESIKIKNEKMKNILDIGCSSGVFLDIARKYNINTYGIELNKTEYLFAQKKGHKVFNNLLENIEFEQKFDAITMWDVFEHLKDGKFYLKLMKTLLNDNGVIFLQIPSSDSLAAQILQEKCNMFDGLEHVNLYGVETIKKIADLSGLKVLDIKTVISEIGVINNHLLYENPYLGTTKNRTSIENIIDEERLLQNLKGYKIQIVLGKNDANL